MPAKVEIVERKGNQIRILLNGEPYSFEKNAHGWGCCSLNKVSDRFYRSYQIYLDASGAPKKCSCPHCVQKLAWCKHLVAVETILATPAAPSAPPVPQVVENPVNSYHLVCGELAARFTVLNEGVRLETYRNGRLLTKAEYATIEARERYRRLLNCGYERF